MKDREMAALFFDLGQLYNEMGHVAEQIEKTHPDAFNQMERMMEWLLKIVHERHESCD